MSDIAIRVEGISKRYKIEAAKNYHDTLRDQLADGLKALFRRNGQPHDGKNTIYALKDVSFEVREGEVVGIIGRNGAGKSTLLKILSRITEPSSGYAKINGRVASLLEVGTGFHPELTGRENIYLNGAVLGMKRAEIKRKFDEIVDFAEVEQFLDTPVKRYSTGMHVRLAFAVAAHLEPEILLVDEVLAVGDAAFQKKCLGKMEGVANEGRTILFVSHNMAAVQILCRRAIWLDKGRVRSHGDVAAVVSKYLTTASTLHTEKVWADLESAPGNGSVRLHTVRIRLNDGTCPDHMIISMPFAIEILYWNLKPNVRLNLSLALYNREEVCVFSTTTLDEPNWHGCPFPAGLFRSVCYIPGNLLNYGVYRIMLLVVKDEGLLLYRHDEALIFEIHDTIEGRGNWYGEWPGVIRPSLKWSTEFLENCLH